MIQAKSYILENDLYKPGKSKAEGCSSVIKLSSNENALGTSKKAIAAYLHHRDKIFRYAEGGCDKLKFAIADKYNIEASRIVCGAGSDEIISLITHSFCNIGDEVLYSEYGFLMYPIAAKKFGAKTIHAKENDLVANVDNILEKISSRTKIIFLANPNNPTGSYLSHKEIERLARLIPANVLLALDLAYCEFVDKPDYVDALSLVNRYNNVLMIRTFSKIHGLASLRLGWSYSSKYIADALNLARGPFNVSGAAQEAGIAAINDSAFIKKSRLHNKKWLKILTSALSKINIKYYPSVANFILIDFITADKCKKVNQFLLDNGVILREMTSYRLPNCLRMTIGNEKENIKVLELLKKVNEF